MVTLLTLVFFVGLVTCQLQDSIEDVIEAVNVSKTSSPSSISNCFALVDETAWTDLIVFERSKARVRLDLASEGPPAVSSCLQNQGEKPYIISLVRKAYALENRTTTIQTVSAAARAIRDDAIVLKPLVLPGKYKLNFCPSDFGGSESATGLLLQQDSCEGSLISSDVIGVVGEDELTCDLGKGSRKPMWETRVTGNSISFRLTFDPCLPRNVTLDLEALTRLKRVSLSEGNCHVNGTLVPIAFSSTEDDNGTSILNVTESNQPLQYHNKPVKDRAFLEFTTSEALKGNHFYCLEFSLEDQHPLCSVENLANEDLATFCTMRSHPVYLEDKPFIAYYIPYCTTHFRCGWLYILVAGSALLLVSCILASCCVCCCCRKRSKLKKLPDRHRDESIPFEGLCLSDPAGVGAYTPKKTWTELHNEWDTEPPKNPGKILLLYSPDSKSYKELATQLKSFIETACHCILLDIFDESLFETIAFDPELWLGNLLKDPDFKIIVLCSEGAYKRQQSLLKAEVLNIPENSTLDGLFSAGLKFIMDKHAYDYNRLALARYEMLNLTAPEFRLQEMVPNREFLVPTQLHELFCWIHGLDPLDLLGKPWAKYHLELQLLQDALKQARLEKK